MRASVRGIARHLGDREQDAAGEFATALGRRAEQQATFGRSKSPQVQCRVKRGVRIFRQVVRRDELEVGQAGRGRWRRALGQVQFDDIDKREVERFRKARTLLREEVRVVCSR